ncbi:MAG: ABC transporter ATP-binding protein [Proteobacteria bacterium]|nr:ABC transporter ATP-binding protein [Pseudomonadota bacterium]
MALIEVSHLTKIFTRGDEEIAALRDLSVSIEAGELVGITGPSGSGKSTLMYILGLLDRPTSGSYTLGGRETAQLSDDERSKLRNQMLGFIFQSFHLLPRATALRNVAMPLVYSSSYQKALTDREMNDRAEEALVRVGLKDRMQHRPNELSGGQRQRVAIARALVNRPHILFADEPTGNLDSRTGREILGLFQALHQEGVTVILVTHDPAVAAIAPRQVRVVDGQIAPSNSSGGSLATA